VMRAPPLSSSPRRTRVRESLASPHASCRDATVEPTFPQRRSRTTHALRRIPHRTLPSTPLELHLVKSLDAFGVEAAERA
jgi:hypothetical protein